MRHPSKNSMYNNMNMRKDECIINLDRHCVISLRHMWLTDEEPNTIADTVKDTISTIDT